MNVNDFTKTECTGDMLEGIFEYQHSTAEKYREIEVKNGLGYSQVEGRGDFDINDKHWQALCKDFSHRVIEELTESAEAYVFFLQEEDVLTQQQHYLHVKEELIDALHFITEYCLIVGIPPKDIPENEEHAGEDCLVSVFFDAQSATGFSGGPSHLMNTSKVQASYLQVIQALGTATNLLKLRPWKITHIITDESRFKAWVREAYLRLVGLMGTVGMDPEEIFSLYTQKNQVNHWRMKSGY